MVTGVTAGRIGATTAPSEGTRIVRALRLRNQGLVASTPKWDSAADVARGMLAMQAQDAKGVLFALSLRAGDRPTETTVAGEFANRNVVRNRPSRGTLQVTAPEDLHWLSALLTPRSNVAAMRRREQIGVTEAMVQTMELVLRSELGGGRSRSRPALVEAAAEAGVTLDGTQAGHILRHHTELMTIVFAEPQGRMDRFALADHWIDNRRELSGDEALAELAIRYFSARGPATPQCLGWWAYLAMGDVRKAIDLAGPALQEIDIDGTKFIVPAETGDLKPNEIDEALREPLLLPPFDEYLLGYRSRDAVVTPEHLDAVVPGRNGMFKPIIVVDGEIVGIWSRKATAKAVKVTLQPFDKLPSEALSGLERRVQEYGDFLGVTATMTATN